MCSKLIAHFSCRFSEFAPTDGHRVCGVHFKGGVKTYMNHTPVIFPLKTTTDLGVARSSRLYQKPETQSAPPVCSDELLEESPSASTFEGTLHTATKQDSRNHVDHTYGLCSDKDVDLRKIVLDQKSTIECLLEREEKLTEEVNSKNLQLLKLDLNCKEKEEVILEKKRELFRKQQENQWLQAQLRAMYIKLKEAEVGAVSDTLSYATLTNNTKELHYYTGFTSPALLGVLLEVLEPDMHHLQFWQMKKTTFGEEDRKFAVPLKDQLILTLIRLRHGLDGADLARR